MFNSLSSGVSGLKAHQVAMDVEANNIANVNTTGFKYSRVDFGTMYSQTKQATTQAADGHGGQNAAQIGLGAEVASTTRIYTQGSLESTDKKTDVALDGNGFFVVSADNGATKLLTRDGDFKLDSSGNFVNNSGYSVQGWNTDWNTKTINTNSITESIKIDPALSISAVASTTLELKANLNSGNSIGTKSAAISSLDSVHNYNKAEAKANNENDTSITQFKNSNKNSTIITEQGTDFGVLFNSKGESLNLLDGQGIWVSYTDAVYDTNKAKMAVFDETKTQQTQICSFWGNADQATKLNITINGVKMENNDIRSIQDAVEFINTFTYDTNDRIGTGVKAVASNDGTSIRFVNDNTQGTTDASKNISLTVHKGNTAGEIHLAMMQNGQLRIVYEPLANHSLWTSSADVAANVAARLAAQQAGGQFFSKDIVVAVAGQNGVKFDETVQIITAHKYVYSTTPNGLVKEMYDPDGATYDSQNKTAYENNYDEAVKGSLLNNLERKFNSTEDLRELMQRDARYGVDYDGDGEFSIADDVNQAVRVSINEDGQYVISNPNESSSVPAGANNNQAATTTTKDIKLAVTSYTDENNTILKNETFTRIISALEGSLASGSVARQSEDLRLSSLSAGLQIYDSLGQTHNIEIQFNKLSQSKDGGSEWQMIISVPKPAEINRGENPSNIIVGSARFNNDGSLASYSPKSITFSGNNGSASNQLVNLDFGSTGNNDGLVSSSTSSNLTSQSTDGYAAGNLQADTLQVDDAGNILGTFTNGLTLIVGKIAVGTVSNSAGLEQVSGNLYALGANSGELVIGEAGVGGRANMKGSALEGSNVDLSRALTQLIIIQRGYQANSKTISTSDEMLQALLQLK